MGAAGAGAAAAAIANAIKASGVIVRLEPREFLNVLKRANDPLVVVAKGGFFSANYRYLTSYKGIAFFARSGVALELPAEAEVVQADKMWMPG